MDKPLVGMIMGSDSDLKVMSEAAKVLEEFSVTATENVLLFAASLKNKTILKIADQDYQVQELVKVLQKMGAKIK